MYVKMIMAMSINGKITRGDDSNPAHWTSPEDQKRFLRSLRTCDVIVIGRATYEAGPAFWGNLPVKVAVMSHDTSAAVAKKLPPNIRFMNGTPVNILKHFADHKLSRVLLAGGGVVNADFLKAGIVDEISLTVEPKIFGNGRPLVAESNFTADFALTSVNWMNARGSILLTYRKVPAKK